jgi:prepilin-type N-terminal cleavage/methylation domain-containing protein
MSTRPSSARRAFTLVEMLVVLGIIGILIGLLLPAIMAAVSNARRAQISMEIKQLDAAFDTYKQQKGEYPASFGERNSSNALLYSITTSGQPNRYGTVVERHLQRAYPKLKDDTSVTTDLKDTFYTQMADNPTNEIDQAEALVLWLAGTSTAPGNPFEGLAPPPPFNYTVPRNSFFEFDMRRIVDNDGDGFPTYQARHCRDTDYVYLEARTYANYMQQNNYARVITPSRTYEILPYGSGPSTPMNPNRFQILCAGFDGEYGNLTSTTMSGGQTLYQAKVFPIGTNYDNYDKDNLTNFSEGKTLGDARPQ